MHTVREQVEYLSEFVTDYKNDLFRRLIAERTSYVTMVLEVFTSNIIVAPCCVRAIVSEFRTCM